jgi:hypothetical protein
MRLIEADHLARVVGVPSPEAEYGRPCLSATAGLLREGEPFPYEYEVDWEDAVQRLLVQLRRETMNGA